MKNLKDVQLSEVGAGNLGVGLAAIGTLVGLSVLGTEMFVAGALNKYCNSAISAKTNMYHILSGNGSPMENTSFLITMSTALAFNTFVAVASGLILDDE